MLFFNMIMYLFAVVCFLVSAFGGTRWPKVNILALGLAFFAAPSLAAAILAV